MNQSLIKKTFIISLLFSSMVLLGSKQSSKHKTKTSHPVTPQIMQGIQMQPQPMAQPPVPPMVTQTMMPTTAPAQPQMINQALPLNNMAAQNLYGNPNGMMVTSNQMAGDGMSMTVVQKLDPVKAAQLVADIHTLKKNFVILSDSLKKAITINFYSDTLPQPTQQTSAGYSIASGPFDPTKQIINPAGGFTNAPAPQPTAINPFTQMPVTLLDLPMLQEIRRSLLNNIQTMLFAIGDVTCQAWNVNAMRQYMPVQAKEWSKQAAINKAYNQNLVYPAWRKSMEYVMEGKLKLRNK
jgi:hypothetical protein